MRVNRFPSRGWVLVALVPVIALLAWASVAWACTFGALIQISPQSGVAGSTVSGSGSNFSTAVGAGAVSLHWNSLSGATVATVTPDAQGNISFSFTVPAGVQPGYYTLVSTQVGQPGYARAPFDVVVPLAPPRPKTPTTAGRGTHPAPHQPAPHRPAAHRPKAHHPAAKTAPAAPKPAAAAPAARPAVSHAAPAAPAPAAPVARRVSHPGAKHPAAHPAHHRAAIHPARPAVHPRHPAAAVPNVQTTVSTGSGGSGTPLVAGIAVLAIGLVALFGGFATAEVRRRRATAPRNRD